MDDVICTKLQIDMLDCTAFTVRFIAFLRLLTLILSNNTIQIHHLSHNYHVETLSSQDLQKCLHNARVQVCAINLMYKFKKLALRKCFCPKILFFHFWLSIFQRCSSNVTMFSVSPYIQQLVLDVSKMHVSVHGKRPLVMSYFNKIGMNPGNVANIGDINGISFSSCIFYLKK